MSADGDVLPPKAPGIDALGDETSLIMSCDSQPFTAAVLPVIDITTHESLLAL